MGDPKDSITIENVVASTSIEQELDLQSVSVDLEGAEYDPEQFLGLIYRIQNLKATALIFQSGKVVFPGAKNIGGESDNNTSLSPSFISSYG